MAFAIKNIEKFFKDHPEIEKKEQVDILYKANLIADERGIIATGAIEAILDKYAEAFFEEVENSIEHMQIAIEAFNSPDNCVLIEE